MFVCITELVDALFVHFVAKSLKKGLVTPRASGSSGYVQKNAALIKHRTSSAHDEERRKDEER